MAGGGCHDPFHISIRCGTAEGQCIEHTTLENQCGERATAEHRC
jgi:hypothetical protein